MNTILKIEYAVDERGRLLRPDQAEKGRRYYCPNCNDEVILRRGEKKVAHFAHKASSICTSETILHKTAKVLIIQTFRDWKNGWEQEPLFLRRCRICGEEVEQHIPSTVVSVEEEYHLPEGYIFDVALLASGVPVAGVEVLVTHKVDKKKSQNLSVPYIEIEAQSVLFNPLRWIPVKDCFKKLFCAGCKKRTKFYVEKARGIANRWDMVLPEDGYRYGITECWKCGEPILVYALGKSRVVEENKNISVLKSIQLRYLKTAKGRYANICPNCHAVHGALFRNREREDPFFGVEWSKDGDFKEDIAIIALKAGHDGRGRLGVEPETPL